MHQYAWLEFYEGIWHLITHVREEPSKARRNWTEEKVALEELIAEGWTITGAHPNWLSEKLGLGGIEYRGYGLMRTVH